ncbi:hypothetical protein PCORN_01395 [Listeria cornellensis FSL F6-0969]|uniref:Alpha/beta hydrolase n=1 Tax=Listeria cornellensis FSL F6-0969 TaxID=1265820 RepID=W7CI19_9LIST|nr:hypothetical protein PCORN_01395 [Listeria cornellensis FSL F6-0969]
MTMKAHVNGIELSYHIYGRGEPLVLLHGNGQSHGAMKRQIDFFRKKLSSDCGGFAWSWKVRIGFSAA